MEKQTDISYWHTAKDRNNWLKELVLPKRKTSLCFTHPQSIGVYYILLSDESNQHYIKNCPGPSKPFNGVSGCFFVNRSIDVCDEWGGAESRGNGARPVEWMIMNDTCATHRSRVPLRSFGRNKRRSDDIGRRERTRPGFYFVFCVRGSRPWGAAAFHLSLFILLLKLLNVRRFPPPSSRIYQLRYNVK